MPILEGDKIENVDSETPAPEQQEGSTQPEISETVIDVDDHKLGVDDIIQRYHADIDIANPAKSNGLTEEEALKRLGRDGMNCISPPKKTPAWKIYLSYLCGLFNLLLILAGILSFVLYAIDSSQSVNIFLGAILWAVACINALIEFYQQYRTAAILESFLSLVPPEATVVREGVMKTIPASNVVLGDLLVIKAGDKVAADIRLIKVTDLKVDNSSITGESEPQDRSLNNNAQNPLEATNLAFSGTNAVHGEGYGIVIRVGDKSILGQIAKLTIGEKSPDSQLGVEIELFIRKLALVAVITAIILFILGVSLGYDISLTISFGIGIFVAYVPQGLPVTVSTLLTIAAQRMAQRNVLVKNLHAVETLGSITLLATDKTGTLTQNKMTVVGLWLNDEFYSTPEMAQDIPLTGDVENLTAVVQACALCTKSNFKGGEDSLPLIERTIVGDATEVGLLRFSCKYVDPTEEQNLFPKYFEIPFSSQTKWHLTVHEMPREDSLYTALIKGAPERVAKMCSYIQVGKDLVPWTAETDTKFNAAYEHFAIRGRRVLAFARQVLLRENYPANHEFKRDPCDIPLEGFVFLGLVAIMDPPKHGVRKAIAAFRTAGIQVVMVTGDHPLTGEAIARQIGLISGDTIFDASLRLRKPIELTTDEEYDAVVVHGEKIEALADKDWDRILSKKEIVFARTSPKQKLEIVSRFQNKGHIVGVSGDGVNDSPALKKADLGISMNKTASDVSKEAAAMILLDDNFASIVNGVAEGRLIFANLKKSIKYTLTHIFPEVSSFVIFIIFGIPLPINSLLILVVDLLVEIGPALSYAFERPENDLMLVPPRKVLCQESDSSKMRDIEGAPSKPPGFWSRAWQKISKPFVVVGTGEVLVDTDLLLWSYLEAGVIEAIGCFGAYLITLAWFHVPFNMLYRSAKTYWKAGAPPLTLTDGTVADANEQMSIAGSAQSAFFMGIVICQMFNLWVTKKRFAYPHGWDMFKNRATFIGMFTALSVGFICVYVPGLNDSVLQGGPVPGLALLSPIAAGLLLVIYEYIRRFFRRRGYFGGLPKRNVNLLELVRTTSSVK